MFYCYLEGVGGLGWVGLGEGFEPSLLEQFRGGPVNGFVCPGFLYN